MRNVKLERSTRLKLFQDDYILTWIESFLIDRKSRGLSKRTIQFYKESLKIFTDYAESQVITQISQLTSDDIRRFLIYLEAKGHNPGGCHIGFRSLRAFLYFYESEIEPAGWKNPIRKVKAPRLPQEPVKPVSLEDVREMIDVCPRRSFTGDRDRAILKGLLDTGARAAEFVAMNLEDVDNTSGGILIRQGKGRKPRIVFLGKESRHALRSYLKYRNDYSLALWVTDEGERLTYSGLRQILRRRAALAGVPVPSCHDFRRAFALAMLRNGVDIFTLQKLMGHSDISILRKYLCQTDQDVREAHQRSSPVDHLAEW